MIIEKLGFCAENCKADCEMNTYLLIIFSILMAFFIIRDLHERGKKNDILPK